MKMFLVSIGSIITLLAVFQFWYYGYVMWTTDKPFDAPGYVYGMFWGGVVVCGCNLFFDHKDCG